MSDKLKEAIEKLKFLSEQITGSPMKEAIDTVVAEVEKPLQSDEQIEAYALENILANDSVVAFREMSQWITGATWMRNKMRG